MQYENQGGSLSDQGFNSSSTNIISLICLEADGRRNTKAEYRAADG